MDLVVHFEVEIATKVFEGITKFYCGDNFIINKQLRSVLERTGSLIIISDQVHHLAQSIQKKLICTFVGSGNSCIICKLEPMNWFQKTIVGNRGKGS